MACPPSPQLLSARWPFTLLLKLLPLHMIRPLRYELRMTVVRATAGRARVRYRGASDLLVNLGSGAKGKVGLENVDGFPADNVTCIYDCRKSLPFPENSVRALFSEHFFEHVDYDEEAPVFLREARRVLQPGGTIRIVVPDAELYFRAYCQPGWEDMKRIGSSLVGEGTKCEIVNGHLRQAGQHKFSYDFETLSQLLHRCGFSHIEKMEFGVSRVDELCLDSDERATESLYVEAVNGDD